MQIATEHAAGTLAAIDKTSSRQSSRRGWSTTARRSASSPATEPPTARRTQVSRKVMAARHRRAKRLFELTATRA